MERHARGGEWGVVVGEGCGASGVVGRLEAKGTLPILPIRLSLSIAERGGWMGGGLIEIERCRDVGRSILYERYELDAS